MTYLYDNSLQNSNYTGLVELYDRYMELYDVISLGDLRMALMPPIHLLCMTFLCPVAIRWPRASFITRNEVNQYLPYV